MGWRHYWPMARRLRDTGVACIGAGQADPTRGSSLMQPRTLGCHGLVFVTAGSGRFGSVGARGPTGRGIADFAAPALLWLFPGVAHRYGPGAAGWSESWVLFDGVATDGYAEFGAGDPSRPLVIPEGDLPDAVEHAFDELRQAADLPGRDGQVIAASLVHRLIGAAAQVARTTDPVARSLVDRLVADSAEDLTIAQRARRAGVPAATLRDQVMRETGLTAHELVLRTRLARAQHLLTSSELSISEIAVQVGYHDPAYFSRFFRRRVGMSPQRFRALP